MGLVRALEGKEANSLRGWLFCILMLAQSGSCVVTLLGRVFGCEGWNLGKSKS